MKKLICMLLGHVYIEEMYAARLEEFDNRFSIIYVCKCARCGKVIKFQASRPISRAQLLQEGWFIERETSYSRIKHLMKKYNKET